jgi:hypothetical protein
MSITEEVIDETMLREIRGCAGDAAKMIGVNPAMPPARLVEAVDSCLRDWQKGKTPKIPRDDDPSLTLGSLWGEQLVRQLGWQWAGVVFHGQGPGKAIGVVSPDRALAIYPFQFVGACIENEAPVTVLLAFNMLIDGTRIPPLPPRGYVNVMDHVHHIVPES